MASFYRRKYVYLFSIYLFLPFISVRAQQHYSLQELLKRSQEHLPLIKQKLAQIEVARSSVTVLKHSFLPVVQATEELSLGSDNSLAGAYFSMGVFPSTSSGIRNSNQMAAATGNLAGLYSEYDLLTFGLNKARLNYANSFVGLQQADWQRVSYLSQLEVAQLFLSIQKTQFQLEVDQQNIDRYEQIYTVISALTTSGLRPGTDSSQAKAELAKTHISFHQTEGKLGQLKQQLSFYTGIPASDLLLDSLQNTSLLKKPPMMQFQMDTLQNPLLNYYDRKKEIIGFNEQLIRKSFLPKVQLTGATWARGSSIQYNDQYKALSEGLGYQRFNYGLGISLSYPLFSGIHKRDELTINKFEMSSADNERKQQEFTLHNASEQADNSLKMTLANLLEIPVQLQSAKETYSQKLAQYRAGIISLIDLTNASFVLYRSQTDYIETLNDWYLAQLSKAASTGNLTQFIQTLN